MAEIKKTVIENIRDFSTDHIFDCGQCFRFEKEEDGSWTGTAFDRIINVRFEQYDGPGLDRLHCGTDDHGAGTDSMHCGTDDHGAGTDSMCCGTNDHGAGTDSMCCGTDDHGAGTDSMHCGTDDQPAPEGRLIIEDSCRAEAENIWRRYFDLDRDYGQIKKELALKDPVIKKAVCCGHGIRILRQDPWETVLSFIISQNNNIPRIKKCIKSLAENFGNKIGEYKGRSFFSLPSAKRLAGLTEEDLDCCRLGYRAKYLIETARILAADGCCRLNRLASEDVSSGEAFEYVSGLCGVGPKVANCILLFGLSKFDRFPIDVWMKRIMAELYGFCESDVSSMAAFAKETYGDLGGIAQQYLFYYARTR